eukprot:2018785-Pyramimonas_sp.AAC.1
MGSSVVSNDAFLPPSVAPARGPGQRVVAAYYRAGHLDTASSGSWSAEPAAASHHLPAAVESAGVPHAAAASSAATPRAAASSPAVSSHAAAASSAASPRATAVRSSPVGVRVDQVHVVVVVVRRLVVVGGALCLRGRQPVAPQLDEVA